MAAQVAEELKNGHIRYPSYGGTQKERKKEKKTAYITQI